MSGLLGSFGQNVGFLLFLSGIGVIATMVKFPNGIAGVARDGWQAYLNRKAAQVEAGTAPPHPERPPGGTPGSDGEVERVTLQSLRPRA